MQQEIELPEQVDEYEFQDLSPKDFYEKYLTKSIPFKVVDGGVHFEALQKWTDFDYLNKAFGTTPLEIHKLSKL